MKIAREARARLSATSEARGTVRGKDLHGGVTLLTMPNLDWAGKCLL